MKTLTQKSFILSLLCVFSIIKGSAQLIGIESVGAIDVKPLPNIVDNSTDLLPQIRLYERLNPTTRALRTTLRVDPNRNFSIYSHQVNFDVFTLKMSNGYTGIGKTNPQYALDVLGTTQTDGLRIPTNAGLNKVLTSDASGNATWQTLSIPASQWTSNGSNIYYSLGSVGIGIANPNANLHVKAASQNPLIVDGTSGLYATLSENGIERGYIGSFYGNAEDVDFGTYGSSTGSLHLVTNANPRLTVNSSGNVGIGNANPTEKFDVNGKTKTNDLQIVNNAGTGKILSSDATGNATWNKITKQDVIMINGFAFNFEDDRGINSIFKDRLIGGVTNRSSSNAPFVLVAPVHLPHGARVTAVTAFFKDNSTTSYFEFKFRAELITGPLTFDLGTYLSPTTTFASTTFQSEPLFLNTPIVIDNNTRGYFLYVYCNDWIGTLLNEEDTTLKGVRIQYEYDLN